MKKEFLFVAALSSKIIQKLTLAGYSINFRSLGENSSLIEYNCSKVEKEK